MPVSRHFYQVKQLLVNATMLAYPYFSKKSVIHTDARERQVQVVILQDGHLIAFYSRKLYAVQHIYTTT